MDGLCGSPEVHPGLRVPKQLALRYFKVSENDPKFVAVSSVFRDGYTHFLPGDERWHAVKLPFQESNTPECGSAYPAT